MPNPRYAVSVVIENGESGGAVAGPVAIEVLKSLLMNRSFQKIYFDPYIFFSLFLLSVLGLFFLFSASNADMSIVSKQMIYVVAGFIIMILVSQPDPDIFRRTSGLFLIFSLLLLGVTYLFGPEINGAQRWVRIGPASFQSSELLKLAVPIFLANFLFDKKLPIQRKEIIFSLVTIFCCFFLVFRQPDLGTALIIACSGLFVLFLSGLSWSFMGGSLILLIMSSPFIWNILLQPFQRQRIATFFNPESDPFGASWNIIQSKVAIGSGGCWERFWRRVSNAIKFSSLKQRLTLFFLSLEKSLDFLVFYYY